MILTLRNLDVPSYHHPSIWVFGIDGFLKNVKEHMCRDLLPEECVRLPFLNKNVGTRGNKERNGVPECFQNVAAKIPLQELNVETELFRKI